MQPYMYEKQIHAHAEKFNNIIKTTTTTTTTKQQQQQQQQHCHLSFVMVR